MIEESVHQIRKRAQQFVEEGLSGIVPRWVMVCGSGLGDALLSGATPSLPLKIEAQIHLKDLGLPTPSVAGHGQTLIVGEIASTKVAVQTGRIHPYEGHSADLCCAALMGVLDVGTHGLLLTCAVGALRSDLLPGELVVLRDQINLLGPTPLKGPKFVDCSEIYSVALRERIANAVGEGESQLKQVVYAHARGPQFETPAEVEALRRLGGDVVGMSTTYEAILGRSYDVAVGGLGIVTNAAGATGVNHEEVQQEVHAGKGRIAELLTKILGEAPSGSSS